MYVMYSCGYSYAFASAFSVLCLILFCVVFSCVFSVCFCVFMFVYVFMSFLLSVVLWALVPELKGMHEWANEWMNEKWQKLLCIFSICSFGWKDHCYQPLAFDSVYFFLYFNSKARIHRHFGSEEGSSSNTRQDLFPASCAKLYCMDLFSCFIFVLLCCLI